MFPMICAIDVILSDEFLGLEETFQMFHLPQAGGDEYEDLVRFLRFCFKQ